MFTSPGEVMGVYAHYLAGSPSIHSVNLADSIWKRVGQGHLCPCAESSVFVIQTLIVLRVFFCTCIKAER